MKLWMIMGFALMGTLLVAGCAIPSGPMAQGQGTPGAGQPGNQPAPQPDYGSKAYGY